MLQQYLRKCVLGLLVGFFLIIGLLLWPQKNTDQYIDYLVHEPLLALPGVNLDRYQASLEALQTSRERIAHTDHYPAAISNQLYELIYPMGWLTAMGDLERQRRVVIADPETVAVKEYHQQLIQTMEIYINHVTQLLAWYRETPGVLPDGTAGFTHYSGFTSFDYALRNLEYYLSQMESQKVLAESRWDCYRGTEECLPVEIRPPAPVSEFQAAEYQQDVYDILHTLRAQFGGEHPHGYDVARLSSSQCEAGLQGGYYHLWQKPYLDAASPAFKLDPLSDVVVRDVSNDRYDQSRYYQDYKILGGTQYELQSLGNYYICPDIVTDIVRLQSLLQLYAQSKDQERLTDVVTENQSLQLRVNQLLEGRDRLSGSELLDEYEGYQYARQLWLLLYEFPEEVLVAQLGLDTVRFLQEQLLTYRLGTFDIDTLITAVADNNDAIVSFAPYGQWNYIADLLVVRSVPQLLLGGSNASVIPVDVSWNQDNQNEYYKNTLVSYQADLVGDIEPQAFIEVLMESKRVGQELLERAAVIMR